MIDLHQESEFAGVPPRYRLHIQRACTYAPTAPGFRDLPRSYLLLVQEIVKIINLDDVGKPIYASRKFFAAQINRGLKTISRGLTQLEEDGYITRKQVARPGLRGSQVFIYVTEKLLKLLFIGFEYPKPQPVPEEAERSWDINVPSVSAVQELSLNRQSEKTYPQTDKKPSRSVWIDGRSIPNDLAFLVTEGKVEAKAVPHLMKQAGLHGKRLSDIVAFARKYLAAVQPGRQWVAYLTRLIRQNKDFASVVQAEQAQEQTQHAAEQSKSLLARKVDEWQGRTFTRANGTGPRFTVMDGLVEVWEAGSVTGSRHIDAAFLEAVQDGKLRQEAS